MAVPGCRFGSGMVGAEDLGQPNPSPSLTKGIFSPWSSATEV